MRQRHKARQLSRGEQRGVLPQAALDLARALESRDSVFTTGLVLQELLQGFVGPRARNAIVERFSTVPFLVPDREDHIGAAELRNKCRRRGVQVATIDALLAQLCIRHDLVMLSADADFIRVARVRPFSVWRG